MEQCAYISASRLRAPHILTAAMDSVTFVRATKVGHILYVTSQVWHCYCLVLLHFAVVVDAAVVVAATATQFDLW